jgi:hypothetical protein
MEVYMPIQKLPRGCAQIRGVVDIHHPDTKSEQITKTSKRLYMLTVSQQSLLNKKHRLESQLAGINAQLNQSNQEIKASQKIYTELRKLESPKRTRKQTEISNIKKKTKKITLNY